MNTTWKRETLAALTLALTFGASGCPSEEGDTDDEVGETAGDTTEDTTEDTTGDTTESDTETDTEDTAAVAEPEIEPNSMQVRVLT